MFSSALDADYVSALRARALAAVIRETAITAERETFEEIAAAYETAATSLETPGSELDRRNGVRSAMCTVRGLCEGTSLPDVFTLYVTGPFIGAYHGAKSIQPDTSDRRLTAWIADLDRRLDVAHDRLAAAEDAETTRVALTILLALQREAARLTTEINGAGPASSRPAPVDVDDAAPLTPAGEEARPAAGKRPCNAGPVFFDLDPTTRPVRLEDRPDGTHPYAFDPAHVRIVRADRIERGDVVLGEAYDSGPGDRAAGISYLPYGCIPYQAAPRPMDSACPCELCRQHRNDPHTYLTDPVVLTVWERRELDLDPVCQLNNADELLVVIPARRLEEPTVVEPAAEESAAEESGRDWTSMARADFDEGAPLALVDADAVARPVLAVPDPCGTGALFGEEPPPARPRRPLRKAAPVLEDAATLF
ncbi:hypothetical protein [Streptomyces hirsutus]|uniref:hypothetical protein n=1 Tax=Streptomyces hirsutus TaxID=35620 RepID=UPI003332095A